MTKQEEWIKLIKNVSLEQEYEINNEDNLKFQIYIDRWNAVAFEIYNNKSSGYIEVSQWEGNSEDNAIYGRSVYSIRNYSDVVNFCNILISSAKLRARRK